MLKAEEQDCFMLNVISQTFYLPASASSGSILFLLFKASMHFLALVGTAAGNDLIPCK